MSTYSASVSQSIFSGSNLPSCRLNRDGLLKKKAGELPIYFPQPLWGYIVLAIHYGWPLAIQIAVFYSPKSTTDHLASPDPKMKRKTKKQLIREMARKAAQEASIARKTVKKANFQAEIALLKVTSDLRFWGQLIIQPSETALVEAMNDDSQCRKEPTLVYFTDGAVHKMQGPGNQIKLAASVTHRATKSSGWKVVAFSVPPGGKRHYLQAEMAGIAGAMAMAISNISSQRNGGTQASSVSTTERVTGGG